MWVIILHFFPLWMSYILNFYDSEFFKFSITIRNYICIFIKKVYLLKEENSPLEDR